MAISHRADAGRNAVGMVVDRAGCEEEVWNRASTAQLVGSVGGSDIFKRLFYFRSDVWGRGHEDPVHVDTRRCDIWLIEVT